MPIVGAFARVDLDDLVGCRSRIEAIAGISTFEVAEEGAVGILIEADSLNAAHDLISTRLPQVPGVLGTWLVYVGVDDDGPSPESADQSTLAR